MATFDEHKREIIKILNDYIQQDRSNKELAENLLTEINSNEFSNKITENQIDNLQLLADKIHEFCETIPSSYKEYFSGGYLGGSTLRYNLSQEGDKILLSMNELQKIQEIESEPELVNFEPGNGASKDAVINTEDDSHNDQLPQREDNDTPSPERAKTPGSVQPITPIPSELTMDQLNSPTGAEKFTSENTLSDIEDSLEDELDGDNSSYVSYTEGDSTDSEQNTDLQPGADSIDSSIVAIQGSHPPTPRPAPEQPIPLEYPQLTVNGIDNGLHKRNRRGSEGVSMIPAGTTVSDQYKPNNEVVIDIKNTNNDDPEIENTPNCCKCFKDIYSRLTQSLNKLLDKINNNTDSSSQSNTIPPITNQFDKDRQSKNTQIGNMDLALENGVKKKNDLMGTKVN